MLKRYVIIRIKRDRYCLIDRLARTHNDRLSNSIQRCLETPMATLATYNEFGIVSSVIQGKLTTSYTVVYNSDIYPSIEITPELFV